MNAYSAGWKRRKELSKHPCYWAQESSTDAKAWTPVPARRRYQATSNLLDRRPWAVADQCLCRLAWVALNTEFRTSFVCLRHSKLTFFIVLHLLGGLLGLFLGLFLFVSQLLGGGQGSDDGRIVRN